MQKKLPDIYSSPSFNMNIIKMDFIDYIKSKFKSLFYLSDINFCKKKYFKYNNKPLNIDTPTEFMEKIQWLKLNFYKEEYGCYVDKFEVRKYVASKIGEQYLNPIYGVFDSFKDINFSILPNKFIIKGTHGSGMNILVTDKTKIHLNNVEKKIKSFLNKKYFKVNREYVYKNLKPKIVVEKLIDTGNEQLKDYKFYCFNGVPKYVLVKTSVDGVEKKCFYDLNWTKICQEIVSKDYFEDEFEKPENFNEMLEVATKLSEGFIFIRVDLYSHEDSVIFGELTFFPTGGMKRFKIELLNKELGEAIVLPAKA